MNDKNTDKLFVVCDCYGHALYLEMYQDDPNKDLWISLFERGTDGKKMCWSQRLRWAWHIIRHGHPFTDMVTINEDKVKELQQFLNNNFGRKE